MSTTPTATALAAHNCTLGDESKLLNHMFILVLAKGDGTPFDATSVQKEDIVEHCVEVGQMHPESVLQV